MLTYVFIYLFIYSFTYLFTYLINYLFSVRSDSKQTSEKMIHYDRRRGIRLGPCRPSTALSRICTIRHPALPAMRGSASGWRVVPVLPFGDVTVNRRGLPREQDVIFLCRTRRRIWPWTRSQLASFAPYISTHTLPVVWPGSTSYGTYWTREVKWPRPLCVTSLSLLKNFPAVCDVIVNRCGLHREQDVNFRCRTRRRIWPLTRSQLASFAPNISTATNEHCVTLTFLTFCMCVRAS